jgi:hypothetical protein
MKNAFREYYRPSKNEFDELWREGTLVLDTNVLLQLYRLPKSSRDEVIGLLRTFNDRLWIPHHVGLEFERNRLAVIGSEGKRIDDVLTLSEESIRSLVDKVGQLELAKRAVGIDEDGLRAMLQEAGSKVRSALESARKSQIEISLEDSVRDEINALLDGKVGAKPTSQAEIDALYQDGERRYACRVPPGFKDSSKDEAVYVAGGYAYKRRFGDLLIWKQILDHASESKIKILGLITSDVKEDWWLRLGGKTLGPDPELVSEAHNSGVDVFWMYTLPQFIEIAKLRGEAISLDTLRETQDAEKNQPSIQEEDLDASEKMIRPLWSYAENEFAVIEWLKKRNIVAAPSGELMPDLIAKTPLGVAGYEIITNDFDVDALIRQVAMRVENARELIGSGRLTEFHLIVILVSRRLARESMWRDVSEFFAKNASKFIGAGGISSITIGYVSNSIFFTTDFIRHPKSLHHGGAEKPKW